MGVWGDIKESTGINKISDELSRASEKVEQKTGIPLEDITAIAATLYSGGVAGGLAGGINTANTAINATNIQKMQKIAGAYGYTKKDEIEAFIKDPTGAIERAEKAAQRIAELQKTSAGRAILQQEQQLDTVSGLTEPFRNLATDTAIPQLSALALGGETDYQQSDLLGRQLESGREGILQNRAAGPGIKSSGTFKNLADLASKLSAEDVGRFEQGNIDLLNTGLRGEEILRGAESATTGAATNIYSGLGQSLNASQQNVANAQLANAQTLGSGISSLSSLALLKGDN